MSRSAGEGAFDPLSKLGIERGSVLVSLDDQSAMRGRTGDRVTSDIVPAQD